MTILAGIIFPLAAGLVLGALYFGGLWLTLKKMPSSPHPGVLIMTSYLGRLGLCLLGLYLVALGGHWERLAICLAGMVGIRIVLVRSLGDKGRRPAAGGAPPGAGIADPAGITATAGPAGRAVGE